MRNYFKKSWMTGILVVCVSLLMVFATYAEDSTTTTEEISILSDGSVVLTVPDITQYRTVGDFEAPSAPAGYEGYIFSGWYTASTCTKKQALADTVTSENIGENTLAYAKFVPKEILGVRAQVTASTGYASDKTNIRFVTSVDSANYQAVGFDCVQNGNQMNGESDTAYKKLEFMNKTGKIMNYSPRNVFHDMSKYFMAATLPDVANADFGDGIIVTPYWITLDGTKVSGESVIKTVNMAYMPAVMAVTAEEQFSFSRSYSWESSSYFYVQGGCTDGTYYYEALSNSSETDDPDTGTVNIYKYSLDGTKAGESGDLNLHHANDITYNPDLKYGEQKGLLVVVHAKPAGTRLSFVNPSDLTVVSPSEITDLDGNAISWAWDSVTGTKGDQYLDFASATTIGNGIFSLNYSSAHKKYVAGILGGQTFTFLEANLAETGTVFKPTSESSGYTTQGNTCDDGHVYFVLHRNTTDNGKKYDTHIITVYDWSGNFVTVLQIPTDSIPVPTTDGAAEEPENISIHNNTMYISVNDDQSTFDRNVILYKVNGVSYVPTSTVATIERDGKTEEYVSLEDAMMDAEADETITIVTEEPVTVGSQMEMIAENVTLTNADGVNVTITRKSNYTGTLINNSAKNFTIKSNTTGSLSFDGTDTSKGASWIINGADGELNIKDITVKNVKLNKAGGVVYAKSGTVVIEGCTFDTNTNTKAGGAIYSSAAVTIDDTVFQSNSASNGGAICASGDGELNISQSVFESNSSTSQGGAIHVGVPFNVDGCQFNGNESTGNNGGAVSIASTIADPDQAMIKNSTFDGNTATAVGTGVGEGSSINMPTGAALTLENCQFTNGQTRVDETEETRYSDCGYGDIRVANSSSKGGLKISGKMVCDIFFNKVTDKLNVSGSLTEGSQVVANWRKDANNSVAAGFEGISYASEGVMKASKGYISLSANYNDIRVIKNAGTTGTLLTLIKVANETELTDAIATIGEIEEKIGFIKATENFTINANVEIPADVDVTIIDDGTTSDDVTTLYRGSELAGDMFTVVSGATLTIQGKGQFVIDGRTQEEAEANTSVDAAGGCAGTIINNAGTLNLENMTIQYAKRTSSYGSVIRTSGSTTITDSTIANNYSTSETGAIRVNDGTMTISNSTFTNNRGTHGGVIYANAGTQLTISISNFEGNQSTNGHGGAIFTKIATTITDSTFTNNQSSKHGGAFCVNNNSNATINLTKCTFTDNQSIGGNGGAMFIGNNPLQNDGCTFSGNTAANEAYNDIYQAQ